MKVSIISAAGSFVDDLSLVADLIFGVAASAPPGRSLTRGLTSIEIFLVGSGRGGGRFLFFENDIVPPLFLLFSLLLLVTRCARFAVGRQKWVGSGEGRCETKPTLLLLLHRRFSSLAA